MIGLEYIAKEFKKEYKDIAKEIEISPQTIQDWLKERRKIPVKRLKQLAEYFSLPEEYFQKELTGIEKNNVKIEYLKLISEEEYVFDEDGKETNMYHSASPYQEEINIMRRTNELSKQIYGVKKKINEVYANSLNGIGNHDDDIVSPFHTQFSDMDAIQESLSILSDENLKDYFKIFVYLMSPNKNVLGKPEKKISHQYKPYSEKIMDILNEELNKL